jgi:phage antirepressor YoqD-like protein|nr:MAG TPA: KilA protein [Caudoviricetes sp.]
MEQIQIFQYNENPVSFQMGVENRMVNATQMAKPFGKRVQHFLGTEQTKEFMNVLSQSRNLGFDKLVIVTKGGRSAGTWLHEDLAIVFAQWLSPEFYLWCNDRIKELLRFGLTATEEMLIKAATDPGFVLAMMTQIKESHEKTRLLEQRNKQLSEQAEQNATKVQFYDNLQEIRQKDEAGRIYNVSKIARELGMSPAGLNKLLIRKGVVIRIDGSWYIADKYKNSGYAVERETLSQWLNEDDEMVPTKITYLAWTGKGRAFIYSLIEG